MPLQVSAAVAVPVAAGLVSARHSSWTLPGAEIVGSVVSSTTMSCSQLALWPAASVPVKVRITVFVPPQPGVVTSEWLSVAPQLSLTVAVPPPSAGHSFVTSAGQDTVGASLSTTFTLKLHELAPAVHVTCVEPTPKLDPLAREQVNAVPHVTVGWKLTFAAQVPGAVFAVMFAGQVIVGAQL